MKSMKSDYPRFAVRLPQEMLDKLEYIAKYESRTKAGEIEHLVMLRIREFEKEHGPISLKDLQQM